MAFCCCSLVLYAARQTSSPSFPPRVTHLACTHKRTRSTHTPKQTLAHARTRGARSDDDWWRMRRSQNRERPAFSHDNNTINNSCFRTASSSCNSRRRHKYFLRVFGQCPFFPRDDRPTPLHRVITGVRGAEFTDLRDAYDPSSVCCLRHHHHRRRPLTGAAPLERSAPRRPSRVRAPRHEVSSRWPGAELTDDAPTTFPCSAKTMLRSCWERPNALFAFLLPGTERRLFALDRVAPENEDMNKIKNKLSNATYR